MVRMTAFVFFLLLCGSIGFSDESALDKKATEVASRLVLFDNLAADLNSSESQSKLANIKADLIIIFNDFLTAAGLSMIKLPGTTVVPGAFSFPGRIIIQYDDPITKKLFHRFSIKDEFDRVKIDLTKVETGIDHFDLVHKKIRAKSLKVQAVFKLFLLDYNEPFDAWELAKAYKRLEGVKITMTDMFFGPASENLKLAKNDKVKGTAIKISIVYDEDKKENNLLPHKYKIMTHWLERRPLRKNAKKTGIRSASNYQKIEIRNGKAQRLKLKKEKIGRTLPGVLKQSFYKK